MSNVNGKAHLWITSLLTASYVRRFFTLTAYSWMRVCMNNLLPNSSSLNTPGIKCCLKSCAKHEMLSWAALLALKISFLQKRTIANPGTRLWIKAICQWNSFCFISDYLLQLFLQRLHRNPLCASLQINIQKIVFTRANHTLALSMKNLQSCRWQYQASGSLKFIYAKFNLPRVWVILMNEGLQ